MTKAVFEGVNYTVRNGTNNKDTLVGGLGNDWFKGGAGNDIIIDLLGNNLFDGGAGSDTIIGGIGRDTFIHRRAENIGARDRYDGGLGTDTLRLELTSAEWTRADVQADIASYLAHTSSLKNKLLGLVGLTTDFTFRSMDLTISNIEKLEVVVDGVELDPKDEAVIARGETLNISGNGAQSINLLANDSVPDRVASLSFASIPGSAYGQIAVVPSLNGAIQTAMLTFTPNANYASLGAGVTRTETVTYTIRDVDGDTATATATINIVGVNDAPVAFADTATTNEDTPVTIDVLANDTDVDSDTLTLVSVTAPNGKGSASIVNGLVVFDPGQDFQGLNAGQSEIVQLTYQVRDPSGALSNSVVTVTVNGADDGIPPDTVVVTTAFTTAFGQNGDSKMYAAPTGSTLVGDQSIYSDSPEYFTDLRGQVAGNDSIYGSNSLVWNDFLFGDTMALVPGYQPLSGWVGTPGSITTGFPATGIPFRFGHDYIDAGDGTDYLVGDVQYVEFYFSPASPAEFIFGSDELHGGRGDDNIIGDLDFMTYSAGVTDVRLVFGNDIIVGGEGNDLLFGDFSSGNADYYSSFSTFGDDTFIFAPGSGHDEIGDFGNGADKLDVSAYGIHNFSEVTWSLSQNGNSTIIDLDGPDESAASILLFNYTDLKASDFIFA